jgi:hypothetical protein
MEKRKKEDVNELGVQDNRKMPNTQPKKELIFTDYVPAIGGHTHNKS